MEPLCTAVPSGLVVCNECAHVSASFESADRHQRGHTPQMPQISPSLLPQSLLSCCSTLPSGYLACNECGYVSTSFPSNLNSTEWFSTQEKFEKVAWRFKINGHKKIHIWKCHVTFSNKWPQKNSYLKTSRDVFKQMAQKNLNLKTSRDVFKFK